MSTHTIPAYYLLSESGRKAALLAGLPGAQIQIVQAPLTPEWISLCHVPPDGQAVAFVGYRPTDGLKDLTPSPYSNHGVVLSCTVEQRTWDAPHLVEKVGTHQFDAPQTPESLLAWEQARALRLAQERAAAEAALSSMVETYRAAKADKDAQREAEAQRRRAEEQGCKAEREAAAAQNLAEATPWIEAHGSPRLSKAVLAGMVKESLGLYREERLALERPEWSYGSTSCGRTDTDPSEEALDALLDARAADPDVRLLWCPAEKREVLCGVLLGEEVYRFVGPLPVEDEE